MTPETETKTTGRKEWIPTDEQREIITEINQFLADNELTAHDLARHTLNQSTGAPRDVKNWKNKLAVFKYGAGDAWPMLRDFMAAHEVLKGIVAAKKSGGFQYEKTLAYREFLAAVQEAEAVQGVGSAERLVIALGVTGNGKSAACKEVSLKTASGVMVHGSRFWKLGLGAFLRDTSLKLGLATERPATKRRGPRPMKEEDLKRALIDRLATVRTTLMLEELSEGNLSAGLLELWVEILNTTMATLVLAINPDGLSFLRTIGLTRREMREGRAMSDTAKQFLRRGVIVPFDEVEECAVLGLLEQRLKDASEAELEDAVPLLTEAGNRDGGYSLVRWAVLALAKAALPLTTAHVAAVIGRYCRKFAEPCTSRALTVRGRGMRAA